MKTTLSVLALSLVATTAGLRAQSEPLPPVTAGQIGFSVRGQQGTNGIFCSGFQCAPLTLGITRGEQLAFDIRSQPSSPWVLLVGAQALPLCQPVPGIGNLWAGPGFLVLAGTITGSDTVRCWGGLQTLTIPVPSAIPLQTSAVFQVVTDVVGPNTPSKIPVFSAPVKLTVTM